MTGPVRPPRSIGDVARPAAAALAALLAAGCTPHPETLQDRALATVGPTPTWAGELPGSLPHVDRVALWLDFDLDRDDDLALSEDGWVHLVENVAGDLTRVASVEAFAGGTVTAMDWTAFSTDGWGLLAVAGLSVEDVQVRVYSVQDGDLVLQWSDPGESLPLPSGVAWGDCDGDGDPDLAVANGWQPPVVLEGDAGSWTQVWTGVEAPDGGRIGWVDADGDGTSELAQLSDSSAVLLHAGAGDCAALTGLPVGDEPAMDFAWADLDGDGDPDLVTTSPLGVDLRTTESGLPSVPTRLADLQLERSDRLHLVDLQDKGWRDVVAGSHVVPALGEGAFGEVEALPCLFEACGEPLDWGELDGDGRADLLTRNGDVLPGRDVVRVRQHREGTVGYSVRREFSWLSPRDALMLDWDRDGRLDVVVAGWGWSGIFAEISDTNATESEAPLFTFGEGLAGQALASCDLDGDGIGDLAVAYADRGVAIYRNQATEPVEWGWLPDRSGSFDVPPPATAVACIDWDGDGVQDLAVGYMGAPPAVFSPTTSGFQESWAADDEPMWTRSLAWAARRSVDSGPALAASNLSGPDRIYETSPDGTALVRELRPDRATSALLWSGGPPASPDVGGQSETPLLVAGALDGLLAVLQVDSWPPLEVESRQFAEPIIDLAAGDLDGDPRPDYVVGTLQIPWMVSGPWLWNLAGGGGYQLRPTGAVALGDVNGDGALDFVRAPGLKSGEQEYPAVTLQRSWLSLSEVVEAEGYPALTSVEDLALGDVDGDGRLDVLVTGPWGTLTGLGTGDREEPFQFKDAPSMPGGAVAFGASQEGGLLALQDEETLELLVFRARGVEGAGRIRFDLAERIQLVRAAADLTWIDFDLDGDLDLAAAGDHWVGAELYTGTTLFENRDGGFSPLWSSGTGDVTSISWGDVDGDGRPDLAEGSASGYDVVLVNTWDYDDKPMRAVQLFDGLATRRVHLGDWNGDGLADLLRAGQGSSGLVLHRNVHGITDGWFTEVWSATQEQDIDDVLWQDLDADGDLDIVAIVADETTTQILLAANPDWGTTLREAALLKTGDGAPFHRIVATDADDDGDPDLVLAGRTLRVLESPVHALPALPNTPVYPWLGGPEGQRLAEAWASSASITDGRLEFPCALFDGEGDLPVEAAIRLEYAVAASTVWRLGEFEVVDVEPTGSGGEHTCRVVWQVPDEGLSSPAVQVRFSLLWQGPGAVAGLVQHGRVGALSPSFPMDVPPDADADGFRAGVDCDDSDPDVRPGVPEICDDGIDQDCDGGDGGPFDPHCWPEAWTCDCRVGPGRGPGPALLLALPLLVLALRRRRRRATAGLLLALLLLPSPGRAAPDPIRELLEADRCDEALPLARARAEATPDAASLTLLGEAALCVGRDREAAVAWRRAAAQGGVDPLLELRLQRLEARLASLVVQVSVPRAPPPPEVRVFLGDELLTPVPDPSGKAVLDTLTPGTRLSLRVGGPGYSQELIDLSPLQEGEQRVVEVELNFLGFGLLRFGDPPPPGCEIVAELPTGDAPYEAGTALDVAAGPIRLRATGALGAREVEVEVPRDGVAVVDPAACCPAGLALRSVPSGSVLRLGAAGERVVTASQPASSLDPETGVPLSPPVFVGSLDPGRLSLQVEHDLLGTWPVEVELEGGRELTLDLEPGQMPGATVVRRAFRRHRRAVEARFTVGLALSLAAAHALGIVAAALWYRADAVGHTANTWKLAGEAAESRGDEPAMAEIFLEWEPRHREYRGLVAGGSVSAGFAVLASGFAVALSIDFGRRRITWRGWDPATALPQEP